jgi:hypothetical protein
MEGLHEPSSGQRLERLRDLRSAPSTKIGAQEMDNVFHERKRNRRSGHSEPKKTLVVKSDAESDERDRDDRPELTSGQTG